jgi:hypothetical protein
MSDQSAVPFPVSLLWANAMNGVLLQVHRLGERLTEEDFRAYIKGEGPTSEFVPDNGKAVNPERSKSWHLGRVKYFYQSFIVGVAVEPIMIAYYQEIGVVAQDGAHRVIGAYFAGKQEIDVLSSPLVVRLLELFEKSKRG